MLYRLGVIISIIALSLVWGSRIFAFDSGQWENTDPELRQWYQSLMQPDNPAVSCCGEADAYWCDEIFSRTEVDPNNPPAKRTYNFCKITDDRPDGPLRRKHYDIGTEIRIPDHKMKWGPNDPQEPTIARNPTGHSIVFLSRGDYVYCFVLGTGI